MLATEAANRMERARVIFENLADGLLSVDAQGRILALNPAAESMLQWSHDELVGKEEDETIHSRDRFGGSIPKAERRMLRVLGSGEVVRSEHDVFTRQDGSTFQVAFTAAPVRVVARSRASPSAKSPSARRSSRSAPRGSTSWTPSTMSTTS